MTIMRSVASIGSLQGNEIMVCGRANTALGYQAVAIKLSENGDIIWSREYGDGPYEGLGFLNEVSGNRYLFGGRMSLVDGPYFVQTDANGFSACLTEVFEFTAYELSAVIYSPQVSTEDPDVEPMSPSFEESSFDISENIICSGTVAVENTIAPQSIFRVYPNPADNYISIEISDKSKSGFGIELHNLQGELIHYTGSYDQKMVIETPFTPGIYFITVRNIEEHSCYHEKILIK